MAHPRHFKSLVALVVLVATVASLAIAAPAFAQRTSIVTQADCNAGRITDRQGNVLRGERCERLIGRRVNLARTGFEAWMVAALGGLALAGGLALRRRPSVRLQS